MEHSRKSTQLPSLSRRRRDWAQLFARMVCVLFASIGILPLAATALARSPLLNAWAARESSKVLSAQGLHASYAIEVHLWPLELELSNVRIDSSDGGKPALTSDRLSARPRLFPLLAGKLAIDQIDIDQPSIRIVLKDGELQNLPIKLPKSDPSAPSKPFHSPVSVFAVTGAAVDVTVDDMHLVASEVDVDVTTEEDSDLGSSFEIATRIGRASFHRSRIEDRSGTPLLAVDDDTLCSLEARVRYEPTMLLVRRFNAQGSADLEPAGDSAPRCNLPADDKRRVEVSLSHLRVLFPEKTAAESAAASASASASGSASGSAGETKMALPRVDGHVRLRAPVGLAERAANLPETDGWVGFEGDLRYAEDTTLPDVNAHIEAHDLRLDKYRFAKEIQSDIVVQKNVITSPKTIVHIADGVATLTDIEVEPLAKGIPIRTRLDASGVSFFALMRDLGISQHPHVAWDIRELHVPSFKGTILPLHLDGDLTGKTANFSVADIAQDDPRHARIIGFREATLATHVAVRPAALEFQQVRSQLDRSSIEGGYVSIGFHNDLKVDVALAKVDLADITPLGAIPLAGQAVVEAHVSGLFSNPHLEADASIQSFVLGGTPFGNVNAGHVTFEGETVDLRNVKAQKGKSAYELPTARLDFGGKANMQMDAIATSSALGLRDFFAIFAMDDDPRFEQLDASIATHANLHVALGGPEDVCGDGLIDVRATAHVRDVSLFDEHFDDGDLDLEYRWEDRLGGIQGADIDVRAFSLHKQHTIGKQPVGSVLGSARIHRGGSLHSSLVIEGLPLIRVQMLGALQGKVDGSLSGVASVDGTVDAFELDTDADITPVRIRGVPFGPSHVHLAMTQRSSPSKAIGKTRCGLPIYAPFDKEAYLRDTSSAGDYTVDGDLAGGAVHLQHFSMTRQKSPVVSGKVSLRKLDLGAFAHLALDAAPTTDDNDAAIGGAPDVTGEVSGDLVIARAQIDDLAHASIRYAPTSLSLERAGQRIVLRPTNEIVALEGDLLTLPPLVFDLQAPHGLHGAFTLHGSVTHLTHEAALNLTTELSPIDLGLMVGVVPKVERALGSLSGSLRVTGHARSPIVDGELHVHGGELAVKGLPSVISEVEIDVKADTTEVRLTRATAKFAGGTVSASGIMPVRGLTFGVAEGQVTARAIHLAPVDGVNATIDADLAVALNNGAAEGPTAQLPRITGDVVITQFEYTRPINLTTDLGLGGKAKRTVVDSYDPSLDALSLELRVRSRVPLRIRNNLVEVSLGIDSGVLAVSGTNQRVGLRGDLKANAGGRFHVRANDFEIRQAYIRFDDPTRIAPNVDVLAVTEYRRYTDTSAGAAAGAGSAGAAAGVSRSGGLWRITLHAYGDADNLHVDMTSDPPLSQEDIVLLLTIGMTRAEVDQLQAGSLGATAALEALATVSGADRAVKNAIPVIDDFRFGSAYSTKTGRTEPQVTVGKRLTENVRASVTTGLTGDQDRELRSNIEWRLNQRVSVQGSYDNINDVSSSTVGNIGVDFRWRLEFE